MTKYPKGVLMSERGDYRGHNGTQLSFGSYNNTRIAFDTWKEAREFLVFMGAEDTDSWTYSEAARWVRTEKGRESFIAWQAAKRIGAI